jgi:hypothetical protein
MKALILVVAASCLLLPGCATYREATEDERFEQVTGVDKHSSYPAVRRDSFEKVNLLELVDPENQAEREFRKNWTFTELRMGADYDKRSRAIGAKYDLALAWFRQRNDISDDEKRRRRNSIQERIISVSISRCNVFKTYLRRDQADKNFLLGTATTVAGVLGAVLPGVDTARYLAGTAGIFSGIRSEYNQAYFANLAAHVIAKGIETRQELVYRRIQREGQSKSIDDYPLEAAIKDAVYFDGLCSVVAGLDQASASVDATTEPGMDAAMRTVLRARLLKEAADMPAEMLLKPETLESMGLAGTRLGLSLVGSARGEPVPAPVETDTFVSATRMVERINAAADNVAKAIETAAMSRKMVLIAKLKGIDEATALAAKGPKEGELFKAVRSNIAEKLLKPLNLDACYAKLAAGAVDHRIKAADLLGKATTDAERATAELALNEAKSAVALAHEKLRTKEKLVLLEMEKYREFRTKAIQQVNLESGEDALDRLMAEVTRDPPAPTFSSIPSCSE